MKRLHILSFSTAGAAVARRIAAGLDPAFWQVQCSSAQKSDPNYISLASWTKQAFAQAQALVFVGSCGIAVRAIAPYVSSKAADPAVVVVDDGAAFAISLLSGHLGGANRLAEEIGWLLHATPVVTTATDRAGKLSVDQWAAEQGLAICTLKEAKAVSAALLEGEAVGFCSDFPLEGQLPQGLVMQAEGSLGIAVTVREASPFQTTLRLVPPVVTLGIGCRKGATAEAVQSAVAKALAAYQISPYGVSVVCSIDLKAQEAGLLQFCSGNGLALRTFSAAQLSQVQGSFTPSAFVRGVTGVDNVCERSAVLGSGGGRLLMPKQTHNGVTVAAAVGRFTLRFD